MDPQCASGGLFICSLIYGATFLCFYVDIINDLSYIRVAQSAAMLGWCFSYFEAFPFSRLSF